MTFVSPVTQEPCLTKSNLQLQIMPLPDMAVETTAAPKVDKTVSSKSEIRTVSEPTFWDSSDDDDSLVETVDGLQTSQLPKQITQVCSSGKSSNSTMNGHDEDQIMDDEMVTIAERVPAQETRLAQETNNQHPAEKATSKRKIDFMASFAPLKRKHEEIARHGDCYGQE
jgi:hypothetical protein